MPTPLPLVHPPPRSFKPRRRSLSSSRAEAYRTAMARWGLAVDGPLLSFESIFGAPGHVVLDIGFGSGEALVELAELRPHEHVVGIDVHTPGVAAVLAAVETRALRNIRVVEGDAVEFARRIPPRSLDEIRVFFPDPWPKRRQQVRRLIRADVVAHLASLLRPGAVLHLATDDPQYAAQMERVCGAEPSLVGGVIDRPSWRPVTRYEQRAFDAGRHPVDLLYSSADSSRSDSSSAPR